MASTQLTKIKDLAAPIITIKFQLAQFSQTNDTLDILSQHYHLKEWVNPKNIVAPIYDIFSLI